MAAGFACKTWIRSRGEFRAGTPSVIAQKHRNAAECYSLSLTEVALVAKRVLNADFSSIGICSSLAIPILFQELTWRLQS